MKFSIGYNHDTKLLELLDVYKNNIEALYFPAPESYLGSGRIIPQPKNYINQIQEIIKKCNSLNITSQLLLNPTCEKESALGKSFFGRLVNYIKKLKDLGLGSLVVTNPVYISRIKKEISALKIESSVNCYVRTVEHASYLKDLGADVLTIDRDINRNIPLIKEIKNKTGLRIKIMLNEGCLKNCPFRVMHYNYLSQRGKFPERQIHGISPDAFCAQIYLRNPAKVFNVPFIPPDGLRYYAPWTDYYKLSTRVFSTPRIELALKAYIASEFNGNLLNILDCPGLSCFEYIDYGILKKNNFFKRMISCAHNCNRCGYCRFLFDKAVLIKRNFLKRNKKQEKKAERLYKNALKISQGADKAPIYTGLSEAYFALKKYREAFRSANRVIKLAPKEIIGYVLLGSYYERLRRNQNALDLYKKALEVFPLSGNIYLGLARVYFNLKRYKEAIKKINKVIRLNYRGAGIHFLLGSCRYARGEYKKAIEGFKKEQKINPQGSLQTNLSLARCYSRLNQRELVYKQLNKMNKEQILKEAGSR